MRRRAGTRWGAALAAALAAHGLLLLAHEGVTGARGGAAASVLAVQLVRASRPDPAPPTRQAEMKAAAKPAPAKRVAGSERAVRARAQRQPPHGRAKPMEARRADRKSESGMAVRGQASGGSLAAVRPAGGRSGDAAARVVPERARGPFLAHVRYPWQARRMGWQGRVEIAFAVASRRVREARVQTTSGYPALDDAALAGVRQAGAVALADGRYVLPVRFVLR